jgi:hypothetical protein
LPADDPLYKIGVYKYRLPRLGAGGIKITSRHRELSPAAEEV